MSSTNNIRLITNAFGFFPSVVSYLSFVDSRAFHALKRGQSRLTLVTANEGCVRYPTEGNDSNHELTTAMHHLSYTLEGFLAFARRAVGFLALVRFFA